MTTGENIENFKDVFGTSIIDGDSYIELKSDGTFLDSIWPITSSENSTEGTYKDVRDYNKLGDHYIELNYSDGKKEMNQIVYYDDEHPEVLVVKQGDYQFDLEKK